MMKLVIQFGEETCFEIPNLHITQTRAEWSPGCCVSLPALALADQPKLVASEMAGETCPADASA